MESQLILCLVLGCLYVWPIKASRTVVSHPTLVAPAGSLKGREVLINGKRVFQFLSVPYAKPPVGHLRFAKPVAADPWSGVRDATSYGPSCQQTTSATTLAQLPNSKLSEDCLHLNIYAPHSVPTGSGNHSNHLRPVMVWLHGGGYVTKQASLSDGSLLALHGHVIVVTVDYRLDVFGFLTTQSVVSPGNYGLWDQRLALQWVQTNIAAFGGDPKRVTLFGRSAGAYSTGLLALSPRANGLFQRIILQSDVAIGPRALFFDPHRYNRKLSAALGCPKPDTNPHLFLNCLRQKPAHSLLTASASVLHEHRLSYGMPIGPVVDGDLLPASPLLLMEGGASQETAPYPRLDLLAGFNDAEGGIFVSDLRNVQDDMGFNISKVPYGKLEVLAGFNNAEGGLFISRLQSYESDLHFQSKHGIPTNVVCNNISRLIADEYYGGSNAVASAICRQYRRQTSTTAYTQGRALTDLFSDFVWFAPTVHSLVLHQRLQSGLPSPHKAFLYQFSHQPSASTMPKKVPWFHRASHGEELTFVFGANPHNSAQHLTSPGETTLSATIMTYWTNFAKYGNPNGPSGSKVTWPRFQPTSRTYVNLDVNGTTLLHDPYRKRVDFWLHTIPKLMTAGKNVGSSVLFG